MRSLLQYFVHSLSGRILLALLITLISGLSLLAFYLYQTTDELRRAVVYVEARMITEGMNQDSDFSQLPQYHGGAELYYTLYDKQGEVRWFSSNLQRPLRLKPYVFSSWFGALQMYSGRKVGVAVTLDDGAIMMMQKNDEREREVLLELIQERIHRAWLLVLPLAVVLSLIIVPLLLLWILRPIKRAAAAAEQIQPNNLSQRIPVEGLPVETRPLANAANQALDRLADAYLAEQRFVADAAHELRTPLTVINLRLNSLQQGHSTDFTPLQQELVQMQQLVDQLLQLARLENNETAMTPQIDSKPARVLRETIAALLPRFEAEQRPLDLCIDESVEPLVCACDRLLLREVMTNLLDNALVHGQGNVCVEATLMGNNQLAINVKDQGQAFTPAEAKELCHRFRKGDANSPGSGLGLAIIQQIVTKLGGELHFIDSPTTHIQVRMPCRPC